MEYLKSVIPVIESNYVNFTTVERSIADFFIYNREQMDFSAKSVLLLHPSVPGNQTR